MSTDHIVLPVSALKAETSRVFDTLADGRTVYVSKHGDIVAAFRPFGDIPASVAAFVAMDYVVPGQEAPKVTAREMARAVPSSAVMDAAAGLPRLVTKNHDIYGVLTAASVPAPTVVPDLARAGARSGVVLQYLADNPDASLDDIVAVRTQLDGASAATQARPMPVDDDDHEAFDVLGVVHVPVSEVDEDLARWAQRGSRIERILRPLLSDVSARAGHWPVVTHVVDLARPGSTLPKVGEEWRSDALAALDEIYGADRSSAVRSIREGAQLVGTDPVKARGLYVKALVGEPALNTGAMWKLAELSRFEGYVAEAKTWYTLALNWESPDGADTNRALRD